MRNFDAFARGPDWQIMLPVKDREQTTSFWEVLEPNVCCSPDEVGGRVTTPYRLFYIHYLLLYSLIILVYTLY